jgi:catechol O-methyltransferase
LAAVDEFSYPQDFLISIGPAKAKLITDIVQKQKPPFIVEIGGYLGYSAILFADTLKRLGAGGHVYSLEFSESFAAVARELIAIAGLTELVTVRVRRLSP